ncbi:MAG: PIN domain-containing protein [Pseudomonadota bacterium]|nr:PIN domain-containing protein [Pseudomonadota bacterium]
MNGVDFLDTNILVYSVDTSSAVKRETAQAIVIEALTSQSAIVSFQVVQEALQVITRRARTIANSKDAGSFFDDILVPLWRVQPSRELYRKALEVQDKHRFAFYDSLVIAAALLAGCRRLLTEDFQHGQRIEGLRIENPFRS